MHRPTRYLRESARKSRLPPLTPPLEASHRRVKHQGRVSAWPPAVSAAPTAVAWARPQGRPDSFRPVVPDPALSIAPAAAASPIPSGPVEPRPRVGAFARAGKLPDRSLGIGSVPVLDCGEMRTVRELLSVGRLGVLVCRGCEGSLDDITATGLPWATAGGVRSAWLLPRLRQLLDRVAGLAGLRWAAVPDVARGAAPTSESYRCWRSPLRGPGLTTALAARTVRADADDDARCLFLGGPRKSGRDPGEMFTPSPLS